MNTIQFSSKEDFIKALEGRRKFWKDYDTKITKAHQAKEKAWLLDARSRLNEYLKMDYETLRKKAGRYSSSVSLGGDAPDCPVRWEPKIDQVIAALKFTSGKSFRVDSEGVWATAHQILTHDPYTPKTVC